MILTDQKILENIEKGFIKIEPFSLSCVGTNSYDVHLGQILGIYLDSVLDAKKHNRIETFEIPAEGYILTPGQFLFGNYC
jgi:dCTP deaminase